MEKTAINFIEIGIMISLIYSVLKYWAWKFNKQKILLENRLVGIFIFFQIITLVSMIVNTLDQQNQSYIEQMNLFGNKSIVLWEVFGFQTFGLSLLFIVSNILSFLLVKIIFQVKLFDEFINQNTSIILILSSVTFTLGIITSTYLLKPILLNFLTQNIGLIPLN
uniref:hypothetical protein n=1 Tax=Fluviicola sp. TaxID=1917219 RepID=UPI00404AFCB1